MRVKNIIFDLDGTLVDTREDLKNSVNFAIEPFVAKPYTEPEVTAIVGHGVENLIRAVLAPLGSDKADTHKDEALARFVEHYVAHMAVNTVLYPNVAETLSKLASEGFKMAVLSNKRTSMCVDILETLGVAGRFALIAGGDIAPEKKPHPIALSSVLETIGASKDDSIMVGDSTVDIETAHAVGMPSVAVTYGFRAKETLIDADYMIDNINELLLLDVLCV